MGDNTLNVILVAVLLQFTLSLDSGNSVMAQEYDTIVVGMGAAGAMAASTLAQAGKNVLALEAQDRIGGRVYTVPFGDGIVEVGAEWIHGTEDSITYNTAKENNITLLPEDPSKDDANDDDDDNFELMMSDGNPVTKQITDILKAADEFLEEDVDHPVSASDLFSERLMDYLNKNAPDLAQDKNLIADILRYQKLSTEGFEAANDWKDLNAKTAHIYLGGHQHVSWHRNGYKTFFDLILKTYKSGPGLENLDIKLNQEVTKIEWPQEEKEKVSVTTKDGTVYKAENVIVTLSLGVLKERHQNLFNPPLPQDKITAIEKLQIGATGKIIFSFDKPWWPEDAAYSFLWKTDDLKVIPEEDQWTTAIHLASTPSGSSNTMTLWTVGDGAKQMEILPEETVKTKAIDTLRRFLGKIVTIPEPTGMLRSKWFSNEFTRGAYTYDSMTAADVPTARADLEAPLKDASGKPRVLFAGEASHSTRFSTVHGAADTGRREAMRLLDSSK
ncbi:flavin containing amine oxidoreductase domain-containing protein [Phthorimaea operculella]|nr:flavin containing amine oxidoreductase domain-containing protein [Phthorimaea operculella]